MSDPAYVFVPMNDEQARAVVDWPTRRRTTSTDPEGLEELLSPPEYYPFLLMAREA